MHKKKDKWISAIRRLYQLLLDDLYKLRKTSLKQETFPALSIIKFQEMLQKIVSSDYNAIRYVYTFLSRYTTFTILLGKILIACNYGKLVKALKQSFILFIYLF